MTKAMDTAKRISEHMNPLVRASIGVNKSHFEQVAAFHMLYGVPMAPRGHRDPEFTHMTDERVSLRLGLIVEELRELFEAVGITMETRYLVAAKALPPGRSFSELGMKSGEALEEARRQGHKRNGVEVADALGDLVYVIYGFALELGYDLAAVIEEIHASNLTKAGADGKPILREDGKVMKGPHYVKPDIAAALEMDSDGEH